MTMPPDTNPYESEAVVETADATVCLRRPWGATVLLIVWIIEGSLKAGVIAYAVREGVNPIPYLIDDYGSWSRGTFFLGSTFMMVETVGPFIGIFYLTGNRARTLPFDVAIIRILKSAVIVAPIGTTLLMLFLEFVTISVL